jgi:hypothetical protein
MRQLILAGNVAYPSAATLNAVPAGACGFYYNNNGQLAADSDGSHITREGMLVLGRAAADGGPVVLPVFKNNFSYVKGVYQAATAFKATIKIAAPTKIGEYSLIVVKKGQQFNYRNKWTATVLVTDVTMTADALAKALADQINNNTIGHGCIANASSSTITVDAQEKGVDYDIVGADWLIGQAVSITSAGIPAYGDAAYVTDLANKAAADAGFEYTFYTWTRNLYPNYPLNPLKAADAEDAGYTIFTLRFAEPRDVKTRDEVVNQIIQVVFPTGATGITAFETACKALAGIA